MIFIGTISFSNAQRPADRIAYKLFNDFETGELFGWEPYPYAEDIGSNRLFFSQKSPSYNNSHYALSTLVRANDAVELYHGFTRRLDLWTTSSTHIHVAVYFQSDRDPSELELSLGTFDGKRYMDTIRNPKANHWLELNIPRDSFRLNGHPLASDEHIQVVTLKASYPMVYWLNTYTMLMDDFLINGERDRHFVGKEIPTTDLNMFSTSIIDKHFFYGDTIDLSFTTEENIALSEVRGTLIDGKGVVIKDNILFRQKNNEWINKYIYKLKDGDAKGEWKIKLVGQTYRGTEVRDELKFLMPGNHVMGHPRLFFSDAELESHIKNEKSAIAKGILSHALENTDFMHINIDSVNEEKDNTAENLVGGPYGKYTDGFGAASAWLNPMQTLENIIQEGSFRYAFTKDTLVGEKAKKALLKLCSFSKWNNNWMLQRKFWTYYPVGYVLNHVAYGYDMLYNILTESERKLVRNAIMEKGIKLFYRDMVEMNRMPSNITNHIAVLVSGSLLAATAIYGDDPNFPYMEPYLSGIITKAKTFIDRTYYEDGSYVEPKSGYMNMATRSIVELLATLERNFGVDYSTTTNIQNFYKYPLQAIDSAATIQDFGDGNSSFKGFNEIHSEWFVHRTGNPYLYDYVKPYWEAGNGGYLGYLWYRDDIKPVSRETLPTSKIFSGQGYILRSGWKENATIISAKVGPHGNHAHFDQGSFQIMTNGEQLLTDAGIGAGGYYKNLEYLVYNVQAIAHNVMLVDHDPESQVPADFNNNISALRDWPRVKHSFTGEIADAVESDLACVYKNKLQSYSRLLLYTKTGPLFLFDRVKSKSPDGNSFSWIFHAPQKSPLNSLPNYTGWHDKGDAGSNTNKTAKKRDDINESTFSFKGQRLMINRSNARLTLDVISPIIESSNINDKPTESYITLNSKPNLKQANFLAVILPEAKPLSENYDPRPVTTKMEMPGWVGARVERKEAMDFGFFRITADKGTDTVGDFVTDANQFTFSSIEKEQLRKAYFEGTHFYGKGISIKSNEPVACAISQTVSETIIEIQSQSSTQFFMSYSKLPSRVLLNGVLVSDWKYDLKAKRVTVQIPAGMNNVLIQ